MFTKLKNKKTKKLKIDPSSVELMSEKFDDPVLVAEIHSSDNGW